MVSDTEIVGRALGRAAGSRQRLSPNRDSGQAKIDQAGKKCLALDRKLVDIAMLRLCSSAQPKGAQVMYKIVTVEGSCGNPYNIGAVETHANGMQQNGFELVQVYETHVRGCASAKSVLVMIFRSRQ